MKNLKEVARESEKGVTPIFYSIKEDAVYTSDGGGRYYVTDLIRPNTEEEIIEAVKRWLAM